MGLQCVYECVCLYVSVYVCVALSGSSTSAYGWAIPNATGCELVVKTSVPLVGTVFVEVDSSTYDGSLV